MVVPQYANSTGNHRYMGYVADLMEKIAQILGVNYEIHDVHDGSFGYRQSDGKWDGMVGELIRTVRGQYMGAI